MSLLRARRHGRRRCAVAVIATVVLTAGLCNTASGAPADPKGRRVAARGPADVLPPYSSVDFGLGLAGVGTSARIGKAGANIVVPKFQAVAFVYPYYRAREQHRLGNGSIKRFLRATGALLPRRPDPNCDYYYSGPFSDLYVAQIDQTIDQVNPRQSKPGVFRSVGKLPDTPVSLLAFGFVPVTATLHLRQLTRRDGSLEPLFLDPRDNRLSYRKVVPPAVPGDANFGCDKAWEFGAFPTVATGRLLARISDVRVDGRPVPVGPRCRLQTPLQLNLTSEPPRFGGKLQNVVLGGTMYQQLNRATSNPANPIDLYPGSSNLTIPPFVGCVGSTGEDVSRVITGIVSGPDNALALSFTEPATVGDLDREHPTLCDPGALYQCAIIPQIPLPPAPGR